MNFIAAPVVDSLLSAGFTFEQAWALLTSSPDTVFLVPLIDAMEREPVAYGLAEPTLDPA